MSYCRVIHLQACCTLWDVEYRKMHDLAEPTQSLKQHMANRKILVSSSSGEYNLIVFEQLCFVERTLKLFCYPCKTDEYNLPHLVCKTKVECLKYFQTFQKGKYFSRVSNVIFHCTFGDIQAVVWFCLELTCRLSRREVACSSISSLVSWGMNSLRNRFSCYLLL